jgi:hypothetical protein
LSRSMAKRTPANLRARATVATAFPRLDSMRLAHRRNPRASGTLP